MFWSSSGANPATPVIFRFSVLPLVILVSEAVFLQWFFDCDALIIRDYERLCVGAFWADIRFWGLVEWLIAELH